MVKKLILLLALAVGFASCKPTKDLEYQCVQNFKIQNAGADKTTLGMDIRLYNPNSCTIKLKKANIAVFLNGNPLGQMRVTGKYAVTRLDTFSLPVLLDVDLRHALPNALTLFSGHDMNVKLTGTIKAGRHGIYVKVPINYEGKQDLLSGIKLW